MKKNTFTLVEILVVIAIIAILASFLIPSLGKSRKMAQRAVCASNLKQTAVALNAFTSDNDSQLPISQKVYGNKKPHNYWRWQLSPYIYGETLKTNSDKLGQGVFACPSETTGATGHKKGGYGWNRDLGWGTHSDGTNRTGPYKLKFIMNPQETVSNADGNDNYSDYRALFIYSPKENEGSGLGDRHFNGINSLWLDGHVSADRKVQVLRGKGSDAGYYYRRIK